MIILGIDPGLSGGILRLEPFLFIPMPLKGAEKSKEVDFIGVRKVLAEIVPPPESVHVFLERAMPMAMGSKHAFNYGRGFAALEIAILMNVMPVTYVEPRKWQKDLFDGIDTRLKPKEQSLIAAERLLPIQFRALPRNLKGRPHDGAVDALLIAEWGRRKMGVS